METIVVPVLNGTNYVLPALVGLEENTHYDVTVRASTIIGIGPVTNLSVLTPQIGELYIININSMCVEFANHKSIRN